MKEVLLENVRLSFPHLFQPRSFDDKSEPKFEATFLIPKESKSHLALRAAFTELAKEQWGEKFNGAQIKFGVHDGDQKEYDGYPGHVYIKATSSKRPAMINRNRSQIIEADNVIYAGCFVNAVINCYAWDNKFGKGINAFLNGVQFVTPGDPFGQSFDAQKAFPMLEDAEGQGYPVANDGAAEAHLNAVHAELTKTGDLPF